MNSSSAQQIPKAPDTQQALTLLSELQDCVSQIQTWQVDHDRHVQQVQEQTLALAASQVQLERQAKRWKLRRIRLARLRSALAQRRSQLAQSQGALTDQQQTHQHQLEQKARELGSTQQRLEQAQRKLHADQQALEKAQVVFQDQQAKTASREQWLQARQTELEFLARKLDAQRQELHQRALKLDQQPTPPPTSPAPAPMIEANLLARRAKLHRCKKLLQDRSQALRSAQSRAESARQQYEGLLQQRQTLLEVQQFLTNSEQQMLRRWATRSSASLVMNTIMCVTILGIASYLVSQWMVDPLWRATSVIETLGPTQGQSASAWLGQQRQTFLSQPVLQETINQLGQRGVRAFAGASELRDHLDRHLLLSSPSPGRLQLETRSVNRDLTVSLLEAVGRGYMGYQMTQDRAAQRAGSTQIIEAAARDPQPIEDKRWSFALTLWLALLALTAALAFGLRWIMSRAKPEISPQASPAVQAIHNPSAWPRNG